MRYAQLTPLGIAGLVGVGIFLGALASTGNPNIAWPLVPLLWMVYLDGKGTNNGAYHRVMNGFWWVAINPPGQTKTDITTKGNDDAAG
jgi:hypothetical protein